MEQLTSRQQQVLDFIAASLEQYGAPPSMREIAAHLGINGTLGVMKHLDALERKGYIRREAKSSRSIRLKGMEGGVPVPLVGSVRAGLPTEAFEEREGYLLLDRSLLGGGDCFLLRVRGDSMIEAGIFEGDLALVRRQSHAENRDIVVALVNGEATLKRFYREKSGEFRLQPENSRMTPIMVHPGEELHILGKAVALVRPLE